ncbi:MAG: hypothetical protein ACOY9Y_10995 [Bacillota bacterium]
MIIDEMIVRVGADLSELHSKLGSGKKATDSFMNHIKRRGEMLNRIKISPVVDLTDKFSSKLKKVMRGRDELAKFTKKPHTIVINAVDKTKGVIKGITDRLTSPLGLLGAGAGIYGLGKVTLGSAMMFEQYSVSMEHWLNGNRKLANEYTKWIDKFAASTPFEMDDLFPSGSRAIGVANGDVRLAERLLTLAADMAALNPGKTVSQAMEAIADAGMGEYERMKEFGMKFVKEDKKGGLMGFLDKAEKRFAGGAKKLSQTSFGMLSTISDTIKTFFRSAGMGALNEMNPRLKRITDWFDSHPATVNRWKENITRSAAQAFDDMLSWGEEFLGKLNKRFNEPGFEKLNWGEKLAIVIDESSRVVLPKAGELGAKLGIEIGKGIIGGLARAAADAESPLLAAVLGYLVTPGPLQAKLAVAGIAGGGSLLYLGGKEVGKHLPGSSYYVENKLNEQRSANAALNRPVEHYMGRNAAADRAVDIMSKQPLVQGGVLKNARGSILTRPAISLVAEEGPEAIIPLSSKRRQRALELWQETGRYLGVTPYAVGGIIGHTSLLAGAGGGNIMVNVSGIEVKNINEIDEDALALRIGRPIVREIKKAFENRP